MNKLSMMRKLTQPARMATGGRTPRYALPGLQENDNVAPPLVNAAPPVTGMDLGTPGFSYGSQGSPVNGTPGNTADTPASPWVGLGNKVGSVGNALAPYASNIFNAFRKPPQPILPTADPSVTLNKPSFNNERADVSREINASNTAVSRVVDGNTAARVILANQGEKLNRFSAINEREKNMGVDIDNHQTAINAGITARNNDKLDEYNRNLTERGIAISNNQSANLANAADKFVAIGNEKEKARVDLQKTGVMSQIFGKSGVGERLRRSLKESGFDDPTGKDYKDLKGAGGFFRNLKPKSTASYRKLLTDKPQ